MNADPKTVQGYSISLDPSFKNSSIYSYSPKVSFVLPKDDGTYTMYLRYYSITGNPTEAFQQEVKLPYISTSILSKKVLSSPKKVLHKNTKAKNKKTKR